MVDNWVFMRLLYKFGFCREGYVCWYYWFEGKNMDLFSFLLVFEEFILELVLFFVEKLVCGFERYIILEEGWMYEVYLKVVFWYLFY